MQSRRIFIRQALFSSTALLLTPNSFFARDNNQKLKISLAEWSLHRTLKSGKLDHLDFPAKAKNDFGIDAVEYVNGFFGGSKMNFKEAGKNKAYLKELLQRSKDAGVFNHLIMVDGEGSLAVPDEKERLAAIGEHKKWIDAAAYLACLTVRVNLHGEGSSVAKKKASIDSLSKLGAYARSMKINVVVENHGSDSSNGLWVADVMRQVNMPNVGTLPDFGNFCISHPWGTTQEPCSKEYDKYKGVKEMLPFAKGVSAKSYDFNAENDQPVIDYKKMFEILRQSAFSGYVGIEFEGVNGDEEDGIRKTKALIERFL